MTVSNTQIRVSYNGDGSTVNFPVPFPFYASTDLSVLLGSIKQSSGYSVSGGSGTTGTVTFATAPTGSPNQQVVTIILDVPLTQLTNFVDGTAFPSASINQVNDRATQAALRLSDRLSRAIVAPDGDTNPVMTLPDAGTRALTLIGFDNAGNITTATGLSSQALTSVNIATNLDSLKRTPAEIAAGVTPVNYAWPVGHLYRYGTNTTPGTTDMTSALQAAANVMHSNGGGLITIPPDLIQIASKVAFYNGTQVVGSTPWVSRLKYTGTGLAFDFYGCSNCALLNVSLLTDAAGTTQAFRVYGNKNVFDNIVIDEFTQGSGNGWATGFTVEGDSTLAFASNSNWLSRIYINAFRTLAWRVTRAIETHLLIIESFGPTNSTTVVHGQIETGVSGLYMDYVSQGYGLHGISVQHTISTGTGPYNNAPKFIFADQVLCDTMVGGDGWNFDSTLAGNYISFVGENCWAAAAGVNNVGTIITGTANGVGIYGGQGIEWHGRTRSNALNGVLVNGSNTSEICIRGWALANNRQNDGDAHGVYFKVGGEGMRCTGLRSGNTLDASGNQKYGVKLASGIGADWNVTGCALKDNVTGPLLVNAVTNGTAVGNTPSDKTQDILNGSRVYDGSGYGFSEKSIALAASGTFTPSFAIQGGLLVVRNGTTGGVALFLIDSLGTGSAKVSGPAAIVLGAPAASQLGVNATTGAVTNGYASTQDVYIQYLAAQ